MEKQIVAYPYNGILLSVKKKPNYIMDDAYRPHAEQRKPFCTYCRISDEILQ